jgi:hypothetical protein
MSRHKGRRAGSRHCWRLLKDAYVYDGWTVEMWRCARCGLRLREKWKPPAWRAPPCDQVITQEVMET